MNEKSTISEKDLETMMLNTKQNGHPLKLTRQKLLKSIINISGEKF